MSDLDWGRLQVHEVAHAWSGWGPDALSEGRAELLADCIVQLDPSLGSDSKWSAESLGAYRSLDLVEWTNESWSSETAAAYALAFLVMKQSLAVVDFKSLYPRRQDEVSWTWFSRLLEDSGAAGQRLAASYDEFGFYTALTDADWDGLSLAEESVLGTDAARWDTDGGAMPA